ncbi:MAG: 1-(5-phosphoribosyl)-5-[(5-phosphoribosylamino)methylideneamino] imidazole-4-carboxamide isomerase [Pseudomonadota bacterium]
MRVIPAIDLIEGRCVRLREGDFAARTEYATDPVELALDYARAGARWLHVVDLDGARDGERGNAGLIGNLVERVNEAGEMEVQLGGGIRNGDAIEDALALGVGRVVVGSAAIADPHRLLGWLDRFDPAKLVLAVDVREGEDGQPWPWTHGWTRRADIDLWSLLDGVASGGLRHVLCTDISRDGTLAGPNLELYTALRERYPGLSIQSSGGVGDTTHLEALDAVQVDAAITGKALLDGRITLAQATPWMH